MAFCNDSIVKPCECAAAGFCPRHGIEKNGLMHRLCKNRVEYRRFWDQWTMPGQGAERQAKKECLEKAAQEFQQGQAMGVGRKITQILSAAQFKLPGCGCKSKAKEWDRAGVEWCAANEKELVDWLASQAEQHNINLVVAGWRLAVAHPMLSARIAAQTVLHPTQLVRVAAECIVQYAIEQVRASR